MSESLTIGIILTLVFGAIFYYLYSRVGQSEKRVSLLENILLDLKVAMESNLIRREDLGTDELQMQMQMQRPSPTFYTTNSVEEVNDEESNENALPVEETLAPAVVVVNDEVKAESVASQNDQYDKMSNKELKDVAKGRKIKGYTSMIRTELQEVLRRGDSDVPSLDLGDGVVTLDV